MAVDGVPNINNTASTESIRDTYQDLPVNRKKPGANEDTGVDLDRAVSGVDISEAGHGLAELENTIEQIEDPKKRDQAKEGFNEVVKKLSEESDPSVVEKFIKAWEGATDPSTVGKALVEAGKSGADFNLGSFISGLSS